MQIIKIKKQKTKERGSKMLNSKIKTKSIKIKEKSNLTQTKNNKAITLIALVITIVLNCCSAAMAWMNKNRYRIEKITNLMYNIIM